MKRLLPAFLFLSLTACAAGDPGLDDAPEELSVAQAYSEQAAAPPGDGADLRMVCDKWEYYVCTLPNGLPTLCRYCVCGHFGPDEPTVCD